MKQPSEQAKEVSTLAICPDCNGAGGDNRHWTCGRCGGEGGIRERYRIEGSIYEGMAACISDASGAIAHCHYYTDALAIAKALNAEAAAEARAKVALQRVLPALLQLPGDVQAIYSTEIEAARAIAGEPSGRSLTHLREEMRSKAQGVS